MSRAPRETRSNEQLRALSHHLLYEVEILIETSWVGALFIAKPGKRSTTLINALLESWALHVRNLLVFLFDDRPGRDAAIAADFVDDWPTLRGPKPDVLRVAHAKASKEITHLLYHRIRLCTARACLRLLAGAAVRQGARAHPLPSVRPGQADRRKTLELWNLAWRTRCGSAS